MTESRGFTLLELVVTLTLTGVIALLVYGTATVAVDTQERVRDRQREVSERWAWGALLEDALRNVHSPLAYGSPTLVVEPGRDLRGRARDRLRLITSGSQPPLNADADWEVTLEVADAGLVLTGRPLGVQVPVRRLVGLPSVTGLDIRLSGGLEDAEWRESWRHPSMLPRVIEFAYYSDSGPIGPPVRLVLPLGGGP